MGKIYLVPTPIGNLGDITLRALEVLKSVDLIAAEDTRQSLKLLNHFNIKKSLISYHKHNEQGKSEELIDRVRNGENIAVISDAGTPGISDPGSIVLKKCIENGIDVEVLPGATAFTTAIIYSGLDTSAFIFRGFLPRENKEKKEFVESLKDRRETIIFYESPYRVIDTLTFLKENFGNRNIAVCRELTKLHEEIYRGSLEEAICYFNDNIPKGEFVLVLQGKSLEEIRNENVAKWEDMSIKDHIIYFINQGMSKKDAIKQVSKDRELPKSEVYKHSIEIK
ncbi:MAG: 16S rRNA (cytidine(1402)-2'-O)-methyltransferase [Sarcina ventriculi]|uniref:16S rRNA (Cytidine(1402)-2'-O)-methyltransferase n=2 Tax=Sarcina TaxID=1266 RepID=A0ACD1BAM7_9CLOT|nr:MULTISPECIES: 16S rRNA (cytidine(1402)-2'-O)-methyltransferase [Sarcina]MDO4402365.1 16S rRNA (cytidine(1402)-2'-O)-methyltransferase [Clostridiaceae bacterium]MBU5323485.1 16S rRNA (cytidine(1402)-2'-O)-methyltransferase [Sarcina ventriculi]MCI5635680.1 16S rRNA (cytidine(1402)-2'-O)-methyltransferase [Sarcina ventriculi]MDD7372433.1 16S rRNA (cytidine(1402)-2'-O)-methyltransferase [Sarcina ventriculi]MDY7062661.1 16S rRNA (cytidine(1402)-2'-O)-methyltransferase [Sarcina ventriculi]